MINLTIKQKCLLNDLLEIEIKNVYDSIKSTNDNFLIDAELDYIIECKLIKGKLELNEQEKEVEQELYN
tara:strand:- start:425 stop:631 length:207 start_codon:yes stop_codon:yes gene_type:complete